MSIIKSTIELPPEKQVKMSIKEAGQLYGGYLIFFTNSEEIRTVDTLEHYAIPRVIALNNRVFCDSGLYEKYRNRSLYGIPYTCTVYMAEEHRPPTLSF